MKKEKRTLHLLIITLLMLLISSCATTKREGIYYKLKKGDTLYSIARKYQVNVDKLARVNSIENVQMLRPGKYIFIPGAKTIITDNDGSVHSKKIHQSAQQTQRTSRKNGAKTTKKSSRALRGMFQWPADGVITSPFGIRWGTMHEGIDISLKQGTPIRAAAKGKVIFAGDHGGYGLVLIIQHTEDFFTVYAHCSELIAQQGQQVAKGEEIALSGKTGKATGPHLHFEIRNGSKPKDPLKYLPKAP